MNILDKAKALAAEREQGEPEHDEAAKAKRAAQDARANALFAALAPLSGQTVRVGGVYMSVDVLRQYGEAVVCFSPYEPYTARDGSMRWRKTRNAANKWSFSPFAERGASVAWENGVLDYAEAEAAIDDAAKRMGAMLCKHPLEQEVQPAGG